MANQIPVPPWATVGGTEIARSRILAYLEKAEPQAVLIAGPSGYGKTVLAGQISRIDRFSNTVWVDCGGHALTGEVLVAKIIQASSRGDASSTCGVPTVFGESRDAADGMLWLARELDSQECHLLVLDDLQIEGVEADILRIASWLAEARLFSSLVITTRKVPQEEAASFTGFLEIDVDDLRFTGDEVEALVSRVVDAEQASDASELIQQVSGGQAALLGVLVKHAAMRGVPSPDDLESRDLTGLLLSLAVGQLSQVEAEVLFAVSLLGHAMPGELAAIDVDYRTASLSRISDCIPLLRLVRDKAGRIARLHLHDLAQGACSHDVMQQFVGCGPVTRITKACMSVLEQRQDYSRLVSLLLRDLSLNELSDWVLAEGERVASSGYGPDLGRAIEILPSTILLNHPLLLLMSAEYGPCSSDAAERMSRASAARDLAECEGDWSVVADSLLAIANAAKDLGKIHAAREALEELLHMPQAVVGREKWLLSAARLLSLSAVVHDSDRASELSEHLETALGSSTIREDVKSRLTAQMAAACFAKGEARRARQLLARSAGAREIPVALRTMILGNMAFVLIEMGYVARASTVLEAQAEIESGYGLESYAATSLGLRADLAFIRGQEAVAVEMTDQSLRALRSLGDQISEAHTMMHRAMLLRTLGDIDGAMADVEAALEYSGTQEVAYHRYLAEAELAANFLALCDLDAAERHAQRVRNACVPGEAMHQVLRADMVLAEVARRKGRLGEAVDRMLAHEEYILEDNMNFVIAMYVRSFPALLGLLTAALGAELLPGYMLRMLKRHHAEDSLLASRDMLTDPQWRVLATRLLGDAGMDAIELLSTTAPCRVRLFGGLEVRVGEREVSEAHWGKRKARLLFAMLVLQYGKDLSREGIYEHMWPEMDEVRARNNFYVIWSAMKIALMNASARDVPCPYISHKGGVCRVSTALVSSDVAAFDTLFAQARAADLAGDSRSALDSYEALVDVYRGELLPGDAYDDWFSSARDRYRQDFGDAMLAAHRLLAEGGDHAAALRMVRRGIAADAWREDLYQAALRSQIALGQRGAAVETYLACRARLADELGLDPSGETVRLYEQVLAMEDGPTY